jgi:predicted HTH domain antitoxin
MTMVGARVDEEFLKKLEGIAADMKADRSEVVRRLLDRGLREHEKEKALQLLRENKTTVWKAAEMCGISLFEMIELIKRERVLIPYSADDLKKDIEFLAKKYGEKV